MRFNFHTNFTVLVALIGLLAACGEGTVDSERDPVYFSPLEDQQLDPKVFADSGPAMSPAEREQIEPVIAGFRQNARRVLAKPDIDERISQIESVFIASGHIFELADIYQDIVEEDGVASPAAPRLAWILMQLGQEKQARMWIDRLLVEYPGRASSWYLDAIYHLPQLRDGAAAAPRIVYSWDRSQSDQTTELLGFGQRQMNMVGQQVEQLRGRLPDEAMTAAEEELAELLATPISKLPRPPALADETTSDEAPDVSAEDSEGDVEPDSGEGEDEPATDDSTERASEAAGEPSSPQTAPSEEQEPVRITIARGSIALSNNETQKAMRLFQTALERDPENVEAKLGLARTAWRVEDMRDRSASIVRELAARDDLTPRQKYDVGLFAYSRLDDNSLAARLWREVTSDAPELAESVGIPELLEKVE